MQLDDRLKVPAIVMAKPQRKPPAPHPRAIAVRQQVIHDADACRAVLLDALRHTGMSVAELAQAAHLAWPSVLHNFLNRQTATLSVPTMVRLAAVLGVSVERLAGGDVIDDGDKLNELLERYECHGVPEPTRLLLERVANRLVQPPPDLPDRMPRPLKITIALPDGPGTVPTILSKCMPEFSVYIGAQPSQPVAQGLFGVLLRKGLHRVYPPNTVLACQRLRKDNAADALQPGRRVVMRRRLLRGRDFEHSIRKIAINAGKLSLVAVNTSRTRGVEMPDGPRATPWCTPDFEYSVRGFVTFACVPEV